MSSSFQSLNQKYNTLLALDLTSGGGVTPATPNLQDVCNAGSSVEFVGENILSPNYNPLGLNIHTDITESVYIGSNVIKENDIPDDKTISRIFIGEYSEIAGNNIGVGSYNMIEPAKIDMITSNSVTGVMEREIFIDFKDGLNYQQPDLDSQKMKLKLNLTLTDDAGHETIYDQHSAVINAGDNKITLDTTTSSMKLETVDNSLEIQTTNIDINGTTGTDGQVLGIDSGNLSWVTPPTAIIPTLQEVTDAGNETTNTIYVGNLVTGNYSFLSPTDIQQLLNDEVITKINEDGFEINKIIVGGTENTILNQNSLTFTDTQVNTPLPNTSQTNSLSKGELRLETLTDLLTVSPTQISINYTDGQNGQYLAYNDGLKWIEPYQCGTIDFVTPFPIVGGGINFPNPYIQSSPPKVFLSFNSNSTTTFVNLVVKSIIGEPNEWTGFIWGMSVSSNYLTGMSINWFSVA